jgi:DNA-binding transcriptional ArsR family regulator
MLDLEIIDRPEQAAVALDAIRARLLVELAEPASAAQVAARLGLPRQKVNYHLRILEAHGLVALAEERRHGGLTERLLVATAAAYVVSPTALGALAADPDRSADRLSARHLVALAARIVAEVGELVGRADRAGQRLATLSIDAEIHFATPEARAAFADDLARSITALTSRYHDPAAPRARSHRLVVAAHPLPARPGKEPT